MFSKLGRMVGKMVGKALQPLNHVLKRGSRRDVVALAHELRCSACGGQIRVFKVRVLGKYILVCDCGEGVALCDECARELEKVWPPSEETKPPEERR